MDKHETQRQVEAWTDYLMKPILSAESAFLEGADHVAFHATDEGHRDLMVALLADHFQGRAQVKSIPVEGRVYPFLVVVAKPGPMLEAESNSETKT